MSEQATATEQQFQMPKHGEICWTELSTRNSEAAKSFYTELFGWTIKESKALEGNNEECSGAGMKYDEHYLGDKPQGGIYQMGEEFGEAPSHWMSYVAVDDVDASAAKVTELGGSICVPPTDIPNVGRFAVINDPTGAAISIITLKH